jgi:hypothetical protein
MRKRMVLEEIEEKNLLVPGSPENPIKLGEKQKNVILALHMAEQENRPFNGNHYDHGDLAVTFDKLKFLGLIEEVDRYSMEEKATMAVEAQASRQAVADAILAGKEPPQGTYYHLEQRAQQRIMRLTQSGKDLLLKGPVTVAL